MVAVILTEASRARHDLTFEYQVEDLRFTTSLHYPDCDLLALEDRYGASLLERVYFHIAAFEINKLVSLAPAAVDFGPYRHLVDQEFAALWTTIVRKVWAQWRYENDRPFQEPPA